MPLSAENVFLVLSFQGKWAENASKLLTYLLVNSAKTFLRDDVAKGL